MLRCLRSAAVAFIMALLAVLPAHAASAARSTHRVHAMLTVRTADPETCNMAARASWDTEQTPRVISYSGTTTCSPLPILMDGQATLFTAAGTQESQAPLFGPEVTLSGASASSFSPVVPGSTHVLAYISSVEAPPGEVWVTIPPGADCIGLETPILTCTTTVAFTVN
jgi:hypothetical protein